MTGAIMTVPSAPPRRVLIIKPSSLGDVVTALPVLRGLRRTFPDAHLAWLVNAEYAPLLEHDTDLNELIRFDRRDFRGVRRWPVAAVRFVGLMRRLRASHFDWAIDLQGLLRSGMLSLAGGASLRAGFARPRENAAGWFYTHRLAVGSAHTVDRNVELARALGIDARQEDMTLQVSPAGRGFTQEFMDRHGLRRGGFVVCAPPTRWSTKLYPVRHWRKVICELSRQVPVVLLGGGGREENLCRKIAEGMPACVVNLAGRTGIAEMVAVIASAGAVICSDSAAAFIAQAVGVGTAVLFGPTRPDRTGPIKTGQAITARLPCQGCLKRRCRHVTCMESIAPDEVIAAAEKLLAQRR